jgi:uncharacterized protein YndB with AHSA1/START domain
VSTRYRFQHAWSVPLPPERLFDVLADVGGYPTWWPQVRAVARLDDETAHVVARSLLPYSLDLVLTRAVEDPRAGVLEARIGGQLDGWSRWRLTDEGGLTRLRYEQEVLTPGRLMTAASSVARPVLEANHTWMMRGGRRGLLRLARARAGSRPR